MPSGDLDHSVPSPDDAGSQAGDPVRPGTLGRLLRFAVRLPALLTIAAVQVYRMLISPLLPPSCRFQPTCSEYMVGALRIHGFWRGLFLGTRRLFRCHPGHPGGFDPVPERRG